MSVERTITAARNGVSAIWASDVFWLLSAGHAATNFGNIERAFARQCATAFNIHFSIPINAPATGQLSGATKAQFFRSFARPLRKFKQPVVQTIYDVAELRGIKSRLFQFCLPSRILGIPFL